MALVLYQGPDEKIGFALNNKYTTAESLIRTKKIAWFTDVNVDKYFLMTKMPRAALTEFQIELKDAGVMAADDIQQAKASFKS